MLFRSEGFGANISRDFRATAPHFHLIEHGHVKVNKSGTVLGYTPGYEMVKQVRSEYTTQMPKEMSSLLDQLIKEAGF